MPAEPTASQSIDDSITRAASNAARELFDADPTVSRRSDRASSESKHRDAADSNVNVGRLEREVSLAVGATMGLLALTKPISLRGLLLGGAGAAMIYRGIKGQCHLYKAMGINTAQSDTSDARSPSAEAGDYFNHGIHVEESVVIDKPASELYRFWRQFENLPQVMGHLKEVKVIDDKRSHWVAKAPLGFSVEWDAEIINEIDGKLIAWRSTADATVSSAGSVRFIQEDDGQRTTVRVVLDYIPPAGKVGAIVARIFGEDPGSQIRDDLTRFKSKMQSSDTRTPDA